MINNKMYIALKNYFLIIDDKKISLIPALPLPQ